MTEHDFLEVVEAVCKRPGLYTPTGSFYEIASFLEGFGVGADIGAPRTTHSAMTPFLIWLANRLKTGDIFLEWTEFRERFSSDLEALENVLHLYREFVEDE
jgi:hypothetical protein